MFRAFVDKLYRAEVGMKINVSKNYPQKTVLDHLSLEIEEGKILCVLGSSGAGKTTLLNILAGLTDYEGEMENKPKKSAYIFQEPRLLPHLSAKDNLRYVFGDKISEAELNKMLDRIELKECSNRKACLLSGGEKRRVAIARAFLSDAPLLLMDEPFSSLDTALKLRLISAFAELWKEKGKTTVFVTHDLEEGLMLADKIVLLKEGKIAAEFINEKSRFPAEYAAENGLRKKILSMLLEK